MFKRRACGRRETSKEISAIKELNCHGGRGVKEEGGAKNILKEKLKYAFENYIYPKITIVYYSTYSNSEGLP